MNQATFQAKFLLLCLDGRHADLSECVYLMYMQMENTMRAAAINLRALPEQRDLIDHAAGLLGKNRSDFMLEAACERARSVMLDQVFFNLEKEQFDQFMALLDAPQASNARLARLMAVEAPWRADVS